MKPVFRNPHISHHLQKIFTWAGRPLQQDHFEKSLYFSLLKKLFSFFTWAGRPLQQDHFEKSSYFLSL